MRSDDEETCVVSFIVFSANWGHKAITFIAREWRSIRLISQWQKTRTYKRSIRGSDRDYDLSRFLWRFHVCARAHSCAVLSCANTRAAAHPTVFVLLASAASSSDFEKCVFIVRSLADSHSIHFATSSRISSIFCKLRNEISCENRQKNKKCNDFAWTMLWLWRQRQRLLLFYRERNKTFIQLNNFGCGLFVTRKIRAIDNAKSIDNERCARAYSHKW